MSTTIPAGTTRAWTSDPGVTVTIREVRLLAELSDRRSQE